MVQISPPSSAQPSPPQQISPEVIAQSGGHISDYPTTETQPTSSQSQNENVLTSSGNDSSSNGLAKGGLLNKIMSRISKDPKIEALKAETSYCNYQPGRTENYCTHFVGHCALETLVSLTRLIDHFWILEYMVSFFFLKTLVF